MSTENSENKDPAASAAPATAGDADGAATNADGVEKNADGEQLEEARMTLLEHLQDLRVRLRNSAIAFILAMIVGFFFVNEFFEVLTRPVVLGMTDAGIKAVFNTRTLTEGFWVTLKISIVLGLIVAAPLVFWEVWKFVAPGLYKKEKKMALLLTGATAFCFAGGALFGWKVLARSATYYLTKIGLQFQVGGLTIETEYMLDETANFLIMLLVGCGVAFEVPVVMVVLGWIGAVTARGLWKFNKYALVLSVVAGAILTPSPDPLNQMLLAGPLFGLYNISIIFVLIIERSRKRAQTALEKTYEDQDGAPPAPTPPAT